MQQPTNYIVTQCYGNEGVFYECAFMLLSLSRVLTTKELERTEIWIYTDNPFWFGSFKECKLPLHYSTLDAHTLKQWRGKIDFVHRIKIEALKHFVQGKDGNVLYVDTDVVFMQATERLWANISAGKLYMHVLEDIVSSRSNPVLSKLDRYLRSSANATINGVALCDLPMWNAGVLGFHTRYSSLLDEVLLFTDTHYPSFRKHVVEQFAFSVYFQREAQIKGAAQYLTHYWNLKEARTVLSSFFNFFADRTWKELTALGELVQMHVMMQEKANFLQSRTVMGKIRKKEWVPRKYDWEGKESEL